MNKTFLKTINKLNSQHFPTTMENKEVSERLIGFLSKIDYDGF